MSNKQAIEVLKGEGTMLERRNASAARLNSNWTAVVVYDHQHRGPGYVQAVLEKAGLTSEVEDYCESDDE